MNRKKILRSLGSSLSRLGLMLLTDVLTVLLEMRLSFMLGSKFYNVLTFLPVGTCTSLETVDDARTLPST